MTIAADIRPGDVFEHGNHVWNRPELYVVFDAVDQDGIVTIRYLYISGPDTGLTYRTMLRRSDDWGDRRIFEPAVR